jgi:putative membrane protein
MKLIYYDWNFPGWLVITSSFLTILELPLGIEIDGYNRATFSALLVGGFNVTLHPMFVIFDFPHTFFTFGFFVFLINAVILGLIAIFVNGLFERRFLEHFYSFAYFKYY